jgi:hypothetical protein
MYDILAIASEVGYMETAKTTKLLYRELGLKG